MKKLSIILFILICVTGCDKTHETDLTYQDSESTIPLYNRSAGEPTKHHFSPNIEFLQEIEDYLSTNQLFLDNQESLANNFGALMWSYAIIDVNTESRYLLTLPFEKNELITGQLILMGDEDHIDMYFVKTSTLVDMVQNEEIEGLNLYALAKLSYLEYIRNRIIATEYNNALINVIGLVENELEDRDWLMTFSWYTEVTTYPDGGPHTEINFYTTHSIVPCGGNSPGGSIPVEGPGGGTVPAGKDVSEEKFDRSGIDEDCVNFITNDALELLDYYSDYIALCDERSTEDILLDLIDGLCNETSNDNNPTGDLLSDLELTFDMISEDDLSSEIENLDWILLGNSFSSNEKINCIWENIMDSNNDLFCETINNFYGPSKLNVQMHVQNLIGRNAYTSKLNDGGSAISIDKDYIDDACPIELLKTILHESIHAEKEGKALI